VPTQSTSDNDDAENIDGISHYKRKIHPQMQGLIERREKYKINMT
jgi:hypothetical protein